MADALPPDRIRDDELLTRVVAGDAQAFATLFRRRHADVFRFALHMTASATMADDVVQDVFLVVMRDASRYDAGRASVTAWLCGIARNCVRQRFDRDRRLDPLDLSVTDGPVAGELEGGDPLAHMMRAERIAALRDAVCTLPLPYREAVVLCDLEEMSYVDAAAALTCPVGTVRSRLHRARALLATKLLASSLSAPATPSAGRQAGRRATPEHETSAASKAGVADSGGCYA